MLLIKCPYCGLRDESEFHCSGEAHLLRPEDPYALNDEAWAEYLHHRQNPKGLHAELWQHSHGCRQFFNVFRDTVTYDIIATYPIGEPRPELDQRDQLDQKAAQV